MNPSFSVIIPTYNEESYIQRCLTSIDRQDFPRTGFEIIVSDASSTDGTLDVARSLADNVVVGERRGIAHGRNVGARASNGQILVFVDSDVELEPSFLTTLAGVFRDDRVVGVTGRAWPSDGGAFQKFVYVGTYELTRLLWLFGLPLFPGLCVAYRRNAFDAVGGFREDFGISEDLDLSRRIAKHGACKTVYRARARVSTRRLEHHAISTVLFHIYHDLRYLLTGRSARAYPKSEEITSPHDLWRMNS
jgi:cellulose synthase/poly-beta-1,6-N-acetylglucosamine synthase-like glycosyltransferase